MYAWPSGLLPSHVTHGLKSDLPHVFLGTHTILQFCMRLPGPIMPSPPPYALCPQNSVHVLTTAWLRCHTGPSGCITGPAQQFIRRRSATLCQQQLCQWLRGPHGCSRCAHLTCITHGTPVLITCIAQHTTQAHITHAYAHTTC
jgi:hypothetical protein